MAEHLVAHICVWPPQRTLRAEMLARAEAQAGDETLPAEVRSLARRLATFDRRLLDRSQLCTGCGYPLDDSYPHPTAPARVGRPRRGA